MQFVVAILVYCLTLVPAPAPRGSDVRTLAPDAPPPIVGEWHARWGEGDWDVEFRADGTLDSRLYGKGIWWLQGDLVFFTDRMGRWVLQITNYDEMTGDGARACEKGYTQFADVRMGKRGPR